MSGKRIALLTTVLVVALGAAGAWWVTRSDAPPPLSVDDVAAADAERDGPVDLDGTWEIDPAGGSTAGLRIEEERLAGLGDNTAVGRTSEVAGTVDVEGSRAVAARFEVDLAALEFTDDPGIPVAGRSDYLRTRALETDRFPTASFELTEPIELTRAGEPTSEASAEGELTLRGVTRPIAIEVEVRRSGEGFVLGTAAPVDVVLADHDIEAPRLAGVSEVAEVGQFEFVVALRRR